MKKNILHGHTESFLGKAMIDSSVVADSVSQRYVMSLPLYRQEQEYSRCGLYLPWADGIKERVKEHIANKFRD